MIWQTDAPHVGPEPVNWPLSLVLLALGLWLLWYVLDAWQRRGGDRD